MAEYTIKLKFTRDTRKMVKSLIKKVEETIVMDIKITSSFKDIKKKYLEMIEEEESENKLNLLYKWSVVNEEKTPKQMEIQTGEEIKVDYNTFMRNDKMRLNSMSSVLLAGVYDKDSQLSLLRGCPHILARIWRMVVSHWKQVIQFPSVINAADFDWYHNICQLKDDYSTMGNHPDAFFLAPIFPSSQLFGGKKTKFTFPSPSRININMMPFILENTFDQCKLPEYVRPYWKLIETCVKPEFERSKHHLWSSDMKSDIGKVCYLTIQETEVKKGASQRRPGLHIDNPGYVKIKGGDKDEFVEGKGHSYPYIGHNWGSGGAHVISADKSWDRLNFIVMSGGIYMASSIANSCIAWDCKVIPDQEGKEAIGRLGDIEHLRHLLPKGHVLEPNQMYWITDRTPHESLPLSKGGRRQFFRLVTSQVSLWYKDHSTPNPLGVEPDPSITKVVKGDKFSQEGVEILKS